MRTSRSTRPWSRRCSPRTNQYDDVPHSAGKIVAVSPRRSPRAPARSKAAGAMDREEPVDRRLAHEAVAEADDLARPPPFAHEDAAPAELVQQRVDLARGDLGHLRENVEPDPLSGDGDLSQQALAMRTQLVE